MQALAIERRKSQKTSNSAQVKKALKNKVSKSSENSFNETNVAASVLNNSVDTSGPASATLREQLFQKHWKRNVSLKPSDNANIECALLASDVDEVEVLSSIEDKVAAESSQSDTERKNLSKTQAVEKILSRKGLQDAKEEDLRAIIVHAEKVFGETNKVVNQQTSNHNIEEEKAVVKESMSNILKLVCSSTSSAFGAAFKTEWQQKQYSRALSSQSSTKTALTKQMEDECGREKLAHRAWLYQMEKTEKKIQHMNEQLENVNEGILEHETTIKRFHADPDTVTCVTELHETLETLIKASITVRMAKDKCFMTEMSRRTDATLCIACQEEQKSIAFTPCKHFALCKKCYQRLPSKKCPICRSKIQTCVDVIIP